MAWNKEKALIEQRIYKLKQLLKASDYQALKYAEGEIPISEYAKTKEQRRIYRLEINELESKLKAMEV